jgi:hypothetical protein
MVSISVVLETGVNLVRVPNFRVQVPKIYEKRVRVVSGWPENFQVDWEHTFNT